MSRSNTGVALACPPGWLRIKFAARYANVSVTTIKSWFDLGLKRTKVKGIVLVKVERLDEWLEQFQVDQDKKAEIKGIVDEVLKGL